MSFPTVFVLSLSPVTNKRFVLTQYVGGIGRNESGYIVKAEAMSMSYAIKYNPALNTAQGRLVGLAFFLLLRENKI